MASNRNITMEAHNEAFHPEDDYEEIDSPGHKDIAMEVDSDNMTELHLNSPCDDPQRMMMSSLYDELQEAVNVEGNGNDFMDDVPIASGGHLSDLVTVSDDEEVDTALLSKVGAAGYKSLQNYTYSQACYANSVVTVPNAQAPGPMSLEEEMRASLLKVGANGLEDNNKQHDCNSGNNNCHMHGGTVNLPDTSDNDDMLRKLVKTPVYMKKSLRLGGASSVYQPCTVENNALGNQNRGWLARDRPGSMDGSEESYGGSMSTSSSMLSLLKRIGRHHGLVGRNPRYSGEQNQLLSPTGKSGQALLTRTLEQVKRSLEDLSPTISRPTDSTEEKKLNQLKNTYLKNLIVLSIGFMLVYAPFFALRNLQSSINPDGGLGLLSMSVTYASFVVGCICATALVQNVRPKMAILMSLFGYFIYTASNFYPGYYTLVPASAILGFTMALLWTAQGTYITSIAVAYAAVAGKNHNNILGLFNGFFLFLIQIAQILGNLVSSTVFNIEMAREQSVLTNANQTSITPRVVGINKLFADTPPKFCGAKYCHIFQIDHATISVHEHMLMSLVGVFTIFTLLGIAVLGIFLNKLDVIFRRSKGSTCKQALAIFGFHRDPKVALLVPMMVYMGMEQAFMYGEITKAFITCPLGLHMIGYVMMCYGACDALSSFVFGHLQRCMSRTAILLVAASINGTLLSGMYLLEPVHHYTPLVFLLAGGWGIADGIWQTQNCSLCGLLFPKQKEASFATLRMYESIGFTIAFAYAQFLCMDIKIFVTGGLLLLAIICYFFMGIVHRRQLTNKSKMPAYV